VSDLPACGSRRYTSLPTSPPYGYPAGSLRPLLELIQWVLRRERKLDATLGAMNCRFIKGYTTAAAVDNEFSDREAEACTTLCGNLMCRTREKTFKDTVVFPIRDTRSRIVNTDAMERLAITLDDSIDNSQAGMIQ